VDPERPPVPLRPPDQQPRQTRQAPRGTVEGPGRERQRQRLEPIFDRLSQAFEQGRIRVVDQPDALEPEQILVLEIAGEIADFDRAIRRIEGLEWLAEQTEEEALAADEEFALIDLDGERKAYGRQLFILASDATAWQQLLRLWEMYQQGTRLPYGFTKFRDLFDQLRVLRPWDDRDRLVRAGAADAWEHDLAAAGDELVPFEIELWLRGSDERREAERDAVAEDLRSAGGELVHELILDEISYHGLLGRAPARLLKEAVERQSVLWMRTSGVRLFHAAGQAAVPLPEEVVTEESQPGPPPDGIGTTPRVAILDGLPVENHERLAGRLLVDDPDDWATTVPVTRRLHGTQMASLALHGDLSAPQPPPDEPLYIRPILRYEAPAWVIGAREEVPVDRLVVDVIHSAVVRLFEGDDAVAPTIRVIGLAVGDRSQQFDRFISPWARLLDWLSFRHRVLFIVAAGNHLDSIRIPEATQLDDPGETQREVLDFIRRNALSRRLLAPAEAVNALTVGSGHADASGVGADGGRVDPFVTHGLPSVISPTASGFRRSIKPEVLIAG